MPDPKDDPNSSEWRPYIFRATANIRRPCSDSSVTASQMDGVFGSDTGAAVLVRPDGYAGLTSPISSAVGHLALPHEPAGEPEERCLRASPMRPPARPARAPQRRARGREPARAVAGPRESDRRRVGKGSPPARRAGKSAVGYLLTIPEFRDILNRRRAWALKAERPARVNPEKGQL
jgi:hypothetical protein